MPAALPPSLSCLQVLDALPAGLLMADRDRRIVFFNAQAERMTGVEARDALGSRPGDILSCINAQIETGGCGHAPACEICPVRESVDRALGGETLFQREVRIRSRDADVILLLSAAPVNEGEAPLVTVLLQDVTFLHRLRGLVPICAQCKKIRSEGKEWEVLEAYIQDHSYAEFTHSLCPECLGDFYPGHHSPTERRG
jgi:hypothetical protein